MRTARWPAAAGLGLLLGACAGEPPVARDGKPEASTADAPIAPCRAPAANLFVDHVILAVRHLPTAVDSFRAAGFTIKAGRLHTDGLLNAHVKFSTAQEIELMTLAAAPSSGIAEEYARILDDGEGGAYVALAKSDLDSVARAAEALGLHPARPSSGQAAFVSFPGDSAAMAVFFGGRSSVIDPDSLLTHANGARALAELRVEGGEELAHLLEALGAVRCRSVETPGERRLGLGNAEVIVVQRPPGRRPRLLSGRLEGLGSELEWFIR